MRQWGSDWSDFQRLGRLIRDSRAAACLKVVHKWISAIEPWGILIVVVSLVITISEVRRERTAQQANLRVMALDRAQTARDQDEDWHTNRPETDSGQIVVLESMVSTGMSLDNMDLTEIYLRWARLSGAEFGNSDLSCSLLADADLSDSRLSGTAQRVLFLRANLTGADFSGSDLSGSAFVGLGPSGSSLVDAKFRSAELTGTMFYNVMLDGAEFSGATLDGTWFWQLDLSGATGLEQEQLRGACIQEVILPEGLSAEGSKCEGADIPSWFDPLCDLPARRERRNSPIAELIPDVVAPVPILVEPFDVEIPEEELPALDLPGVEIPEYSFPSPEAENR